MDANRESARSALDTLDMAAEPFGPSGPAEAAVRGILVVDDHSEFRGIVRQILLWEPDFTVIGEAEDGLAAIESVLRRQPDVVIMDVAMPRFDGLEATARMKALRPEIKILVLTVHADQAYSARAYANGADAFLAKQHMITELAPAIRRLFADHR